ncbi:hypothetical protein AVEN_38018-1 [Araneus ventricosus]|uniref:Reverse transcriptase zinc-binding domain-containing protein n=1 Tax=Araneus ventricosus TaxID=182803 RepID=A0A4Y2M8P8_ARAVE|nr:hypothetical protein AVEN_38018-1 [Araneus ventricosus]
MKEPTKNALNMPINKNVGIPKCHWKRLSHQKRLGQWKEDYASLSKASHTKKFFPTAKCRLERNSFFCSFKVNQFLTGHGNFEEYLKRFHRQTSDVCDCSAKEIQNVEHIIFRCLHVQDCRKILQQKLGVPENDWPVVLISLINTKPSFLYFTEFVHTCNYK